MSFTRRLTRYLAAASLAVILISGTLAGQPAHAQTCEGGSSSGFSNVLNRVACKAGFTADLASENTSDTAIAQTIGRLINVALGFAGAVFLILIIYAGFIWGTARGNESHVEEAQDLIKDSVIGLIILFGAFSISRFVLYALKQGFTP